MNARRSPAECDKLSTYCKAHDSRKKNEIKLIVIAHRLVRLDVDFTNPEYHRIDPKLIEDNSH